MYVDLEVNSDFPDQFSVSWESSRNPYQQKEIKMIAGLPPEKITTLGEPDSDAGKPKRLGKLEPSTCNFLLDQ